MLCSERPLSSPPYCRGQRSVLHLGLASRPRIFFSYPQLGSESARCPLRLSPPSFGRYVSAYTRERTRAEPEPSGPVACQLSPRQADFACGAGAEGRAVSRPNTLHWDFRRVFCSPTFGRVQGFACYVVPTAEEDGTILLSSRLHAHSTSRAHSPAKQRPHMVSVLGVQPYRMKSAEI